MSRAWIQQKKEDVAKLGAKKAAWYCCWYQGGKQRKRKIGSKTLAEQFKSKVETGMLRQEIEPERVSWARCRREYEDHLKARTRPGTRMQAKVSLDHFERIAGKVPPHEITKRVVDQYVNRRVTETGRGGETIRPATVNKELRQLRAMLGFAKEANYVAKVPKFEFLKELEKIPTYVSEETFAELYANADSAQWPDEPGVTAGDWWRAYLVWLYMTGWRAMEPLSVRRADFDPVKGTVLLRAEHNKGGRDALVVLHPLVTDHVAALKSFSPMLLPWDHGRRSLWKEFHRIQEAAEVKRPDGKFYGFHDLRRAFASQNADRMTADALQSLMRHRSYQTTQRYISLARQINPAIANLHVPDLPGRKGAVS